jgi:hypothetical protein
MAGGAAGGRCSQLRRLACADYFKSAHALCDTCVPLAAAGAADLETRRRRLNVAAGAAWCGRRTAAGGLPSPCR